MPELTQFDLELYLQNMVLEFQVEKLKFVLLRGDRRRLLCCGSHLLTFLLTYLLTPCGKVLLDKLRGSQLVKKFPTLYGTWRFITVFTNSRQLSISWVSSIQSMLSHPTTWRSILILSSHPRLGLFCSTYLLIKIRPFRDEMQSIVYIRIAFGFFIQFVARRYGGQGM